MSAKQVVPERIISAQASCVPSAHEVGADELPLDRHHVAHQPDVEAQIVGQAAQQRHRRVRVRVDEARHHDAARGSRSSRPASILAGDVADRDESRCR